MKKHLTLLLCCISTIAYSQTAPQINLGKPYLDKLEKNNIAIEDRTHLYIGDNRSQEVFYYALVPEHSIEGALILFPATWESTESVFNNNAELIKLAYSNNLLTVIPSINYNLCLNRIAMSFINTAFSDMLKKYDIPRDKIVVGGFSLGGMNAIRYTEMAYENDSLTTIKPAAVYGVDPPLDWVRIYYSFERTVGKNFSEVAVNEANVYLIKLNGQFGGSPEEKPDTYAHYSMYSKNQKDGGNTKYLENVPVRIYSDPDIDWHLKNRHNDLYDMNALDQTAMINQLHLLGNDRAEYINALGKGIRPNGMRHPHSWSIVEPAECMEWILSCLSF